jgi:hypothetical protein
MIDPHGEPVRENYRLQGEARERERIIELLEQHLGYGDSEWDSSVMAVIALIKGVNK